MSGSNIIIDNNDNGVDWDWPYQGQVCNIQYTAKHAAHVFCNCPLSLEQLDLLKPPLQQKDIRKIKQLDTSTGAPTAQPNATAAFKVKKTS